MDNLIEYLKKVKDFRRKQGQKYPLWFILLIVILGLMSGYLGYRALADFAKLQRVKLIKYFPITRNEVPSYSTIRRAMKGVDWSDLSEVFNQWASQLLQNSNGNQWLAIDGKSLRSTVENYDDNQQNFVSIISVFSPESGLVLHLEKMENKTDSEIRLVQDIIKATPWQNQIFTLDALHCQKHSVELITSTGNDYLIAVKKNQPKLYNSLEIQANTATPLSKHFSRDLSHGRHITRQVSVFEVPESVKSQWSNSQRFIQVVRSGNRGSQSYQEIAYYLSSSDQPAEILAQKIRGHWGIENCLHWVKDVIFHEDKSPLHEFQTVANFSILSTIAINLFRILGFLSVTEGRRWLGHRVWLLSVLLA